MRGFAAASVVMAMVAASTTADALHLKKHAVIGGTTSLSEAIPKSVKAVCKSKVLKIKTDKWVELHRRERCFI